jgi:hypothetical protein
MQKVVKLIIIFIFLAKVNTYASTTILGGNTSGVWTLAGSPYYINNYVVVPLFSTLIIEPGVEVIFNGCYYIEVNGKLIAKGTSTNNIIMRPADTTDWHNDLIPNGGWRGILFNQYYGNDTDSSTIQYCTIKNTKYGANGGFGLLGTIHTYRGLKVAHNTFEYCQNMTGAVITAQPLAIEPVLLDSNTFTHTKAHTALIFANNSTAGSFKIRGNSISNNTVGNLLYVYYGKHCEVSGNEFFNCQATEKPFIFLQEGITYFKNNKVHHNNTNRSAAIFIARGKFFIENNLICNNQNNLDVLCGAPESGGGICVYQYNDNPNDTSIVVIRNNVIANNFSESAGSGIHAHNSNLTISNNTIVNNTCNSFGSGITATGTYNNATIKNNILYGNVNYNGALSGIDSTHAVYIVTGNNINYNNNYSNNNFSKTVYVIGGIINLADTSNNIIAPTPLLIAPTANASVFQDATLANFRLQNSSTCINAGDTSIVNCTLLDYLNNPRYISNNIDIGAIENQNIPQAIDNITNKQFALYPNPANDYITIQSKNNTPLQQINLYNNLGKLINIYYPSYTYQHTINTSLLIPGLYYLTINNGSNFAINVAK